MQPYPWDLADARKRPKRLAKKLKARWGWRRYAPRGMRMPMLRSWPIDESIGMRCYVPTRKGARAAHLFEMSVALSSPRKIVAKTCVGPVQVSTVFICLDYSFVDSTTPALWETMIFYVGTVGTVGTPDEDALRDMGYGPDEVSHLGQEQWRYASRKDAVLHHAKLVAMLRTVSH